MRDTKTRNESVYTTSDGVHRASRGHGSAVSRQLRYQNRDEDNSKNEYKGVSNQSLEETRQGNFQHRLVTISFIRSNLDANPSLFLNGTQ